MDFFNTADFNLEKYLKESYGSVDVLIDRAKKGELFSQIELGIAYGEGVQGFVEKDTEKAIGWLDTAVTNGCIFPSVIQRLGQLLDETAEPRNQRKAYDLYHKAALLGSTPAQLNLAEMYRCGLEGVVNEDIKEAFEWYKKAAGESTVEYSSETGGIGLLLAGTVNRIENAFSNSRQTALSSLFKHYLEGNCPEGRPQPTKAVYYLTKAAELGDTKAQRELGEICLTGSCEQIKDLKKARRWLEKASSSGDVRANQLLQQCGKDEDVLHDAPDISEEAIEQCHAIQEEKCKERADANRHPFAIYKPVAFSEEMLQKYLWSPTARTYLHAYKLVKEGLEILCKSDFTDEKGITLIAHGYLTEFSVLQAFPHMQNDLLPNIIQLCEKTLIKNPCFFEGLLLTIALHGLKLGESFEKITQDNRRIKMSIVNLINLIKKAEPNSLPSEDQYEFDKSYSSWLHVLYNYLAAIYCVDGLHEFSAEFFTTSLECCPSNFEAKRGIGFSLMQLYISKNSSEKLEFSSLNIKIQSVSFPRVLTWTKEELRKNAVKMLKEYLEEAPSCSRWYPNVCYYLANIASQSLEKNLQEFRMYFEMGQNAEENRLPFFQPVDLPIKDSMIPLYQLFANVQPPAHCGNKSLSKS
ncbi:uncharacterized protein LOC111336908 isoform X2 [Stylophora pistillata]|uniref:uncharacterized protein LOC111336908 isoform X2 n=1 Tax=Stylophora pistillata TaxID=50429 RepID=UPI000C04965D|nr:uncharacterized protein LOC111336908 isoform X2 [Stylophora pistillata]